MNNTFTFFSPEVSQFLKLVDEQEVSGFVEPLDLKSKEIIILAVNNATDPSQPGGSHWSLLVYTSQVINLVSISEIYSFPYCYLFLTQLNYVILRPTLSFISILHLA